MRLLVLLAAPCLIIGTSAAAQDQGAGSDVLPMPDAEAAAEPTPIVVSAERERETEVLLGSRVPRKQTVKYAGIATNTGTRGLVPQSGMDQGATIRTVTTSKCVSDDITMSAAAACIMADAQEAYNAGKFDEAEERFDVIAGNGDFRPEDRLASAQWLYRIADETGDAAQKEYALIQMVGSGVMTPEQEASGRRTLISWALKRKDNLLAQQRLSELDDEGLASPTDLANLAILLRRTGNNNGSQSDSEIMQRAINAAERAGTPVQQGWRDFVKTKVSKAQEHAPF